VSDSDLLFETLVTFVNSQASIALLVFAVSWNGVTYGAGVGFVPKDDRNLAMIFRPLEMMLLSTEFLLFEFLLIISTNAVVEKRCRMFIFRIVRLPAGGTGSKSAHTRCYRPCDTAS
jgi:hypothetical protein